MQKILAVASTDLYIFLSDRANLVGLLLIPSVLTIVLGLVSGQELPTLDIAVIDQGFMLMNVGEKLATGYGCSNPCKGSESIATATSIICNHQ